MSQTIDRGQTIIKLRMYKNHISIYFLGVCVCVYSVRLYINMHNGKTTTPSHCDRCTAHLNQFQFDSLYKIIITDQRQLIKIQLAFDCHLAQNSTVKLNLNWNFCLEMSSLLVLFVRTIACLLFGWIDSRFDVQTKRKNCKKTRSWNGSE